MSLQSDVDPSTLSEEQLDPVGAFFNQFIPIFGPGKIQEYFGSGGYEQVGGPENVTNVNLQTGESLNLLTNTFNQSQQMFADLLSGFDPTAPYDAFINDIAPGLSELAYDSKYADLERAGAGRASTRALGEMENRYSQGGNLFSGAFSQAAGERVAGIQQDAETRIRGEQGRTRSGLFGAALSGLPGLYQTPFNAAAQFYGGQNLTALGGIQQYGTPEFYEPNYAYEPGGFEKLLDLAGLGIELYGASQGVPT